MTESQKKMIEKLGLTESDFKPKASQEERLSTLESTADDIILMMADLIGGNSVKESRG